MSHIASFIAQHSLDQDLIFHFYHSVSRSVSYILYLKKSISFIDIIISVWLFLIAWTESLCCDLIKWLNYINIVPLIIQINWNNSWYAGSIQSWLGDDVFICVTESIWSWWVCACACIHLHPTFHLFHSLTYIPLSFGHTLPLSSHRWFIVVPACHLPCRWYQLSIWHHD